MNTIDDEAAWLQTQLTVARWHLDAALAAPLETARRNIDRARQAYEGARAALGEMNMAADRREVLALELARIRDRLLAAGAEV